MKFIGGGRVGGGGVSIGGGWEVEGGQYHHSEANSSIVLSVEHRNCHGQPGRCSGLLAAV